MTRPAEIVTFEFEGEVVVWAPVSELMPRTAVLSHLPIDTSTPLLRPRRIIEFFSSGGTVFGGSRLDSNSSAALRALPQSSRTIEHHQTHQPTADSATPAPNEPNPLAEEHNR